MIALDTNVLVRYIVQDEEEQSRLATHYIETHLHKECPGFVSMLVLCELVWVLRGGYALPKNAIIALLSKLLIVSELLIEHRDLAYHALQDYKSGSADYADYLIAHVARHAGAKTVVTFDKKAANAPFFTLLSKASSL